jgi:RecA/RadA recombinase
MASKLFKNYSKLVGNEMAKLIDETPLSSDPQRFYDTGSYMMNALITGDFFKGVPEGKITSLAGDPGTGKTFIALSVVKNFLNEHQNGHVIWYDTENAITKEMFTDRNIDYERIVYSPVATVEDFKKETLKWLNEYNHAEEEDKVPVIMVLDSLGGLTTKKTVDDTLNEKEVVDMTRPKLIKSAMTILALELQKAKIPLIVNNHIYDSISAYSGKQMSGGSGLKFFSSTILFLTKRKEKDGTSQIGNIITARAEKSRFTIENSKAELYLSFKTGLNRYHGLLPIAEEAGIFKRVGHRYETADGRKLYEKQIMAEASTFFTPSVLEQLNVQVKELFSYGKAEEEELFVETLDEETNES